MAETVIEFGEVSNIYRLEREKRGELAKIPDDFFERLRSHITELRRQAGVEESQSPGSKKAMMLLEDVKKLSAMADHIHDSRERKIVILAQQRGDLAKANLTNHERELVSHIREGLDRHRRRLEGKHLKRESAPTVEIEDVHPAVEVREAAPKGDVTVLQVLEDIGEFATADRDYRLMKSDVVTLPREFAKVLIDQGKAKEIIIAQ